MIKRGATRILLVLAGLALLFGIAMFALSSRRPATTLPDFLASPSKGYKMYTEAAEEFAGNPGEVTNNFASYVAMNKRAYDAIDRASKEEIEAPLANYDPKAVDAMDYARLKRIGSALLVRSKAAEADGRVADALNDALEAIRYGQMVEHGPLISFLVGSAVELMALRRLETLAPRLSDTNLQHAVSNLRSLNQARLPFAEVERREHYYSARNATNAVEAIRDRLSPETRAIYRDGEERYLTTAALMEVLATSLAAQQFVASRKTSPTSVQDLVPPFLDAPPIDPFDGKTLRFKISETEAVFYSVGPNQRDDSGKGDDVKVGHNDSTGSRMMMNAFKKAARSE